MSHYSHRSVHKGKSSCKWVVFIWSIRGADYVQWIEEALVKAVQLTLPSLRVSICIFHTGSPSMSQSMEEDSSLSSPTEKKGTPEQVVTRKGSLTSSMLLSLRVNMQLMGTTLVCGLQGIARVVHHALHFPVSGPSSILSGGPSVTLYLSYKGSQCCIIC
ncbi:hypothetical protein BD769DRAFT_1476076 [Suillus cothurnatus]|nr:hypothetical protein BD769DRAFT_1476076 [Suillus cothurnatus]